MYVAVAATIAGQALLLGRFSLLVYAAAFCAVVAAFVHWYEEPTLTRQFAGEYEEYRRAVPAWVPRLRPWQKPLGRRGRREERPLDDDQRGQDECERGREHERRQRGLRQE